MDSARRSRNRIVLVVVVVLVIEPRHPIEDEDEDEDDEEKFARRANILRDSSTDAHGFLLFPSVFIRVHPWLIHFGCGFAALRGFVVASIMDPAKSCFLRSGCFACWCFGCSHPQCFAV